MVIFQNYVKLPEGKRGNFEVTAMQALQRREIAWNHHPRRESVGKYCKLQYMKGGHNFT